MGGRPFYWGRDLINLGLHDTYSIPTRYLLDTYSIPTRYLLDTYSIPTRYLHDTYSIPTRHIFTWGGGLFTRRNLINLGLHHAYTTHTPRIHDTYIHHTITIHLTLLLLLHSYHQLRLFLFLFSLPSLPSSHISLLPLSFFLF